MALDFRAVREQVDMVEIAGMYTELVRAGKEWTGPCPKCGGRDRFHIFSDRCVAHCRRCEGRWDAAGLVAEMEGISNYQAVIRLLGDRWRTTKEKVRPAAEIPLAQPAQWRSAAFQEQARKAVRFGRANLANQREGAAYLTGTRCLSASTLEAYQIGFNPSRSTFQGGPKQPAALIPWILATGDICALKYRFLGEGIRPRFNQKAGSEPILFGSHLCKARGTLIVVEGELNCASVFQVLPRTSQIDVVSIGGETTGAMERGQDEQPIGIRAARQFALERGYGKILSWVDTRERALEHGPILAGLSYRLMQSPGGKDANDILCQMGPQVLRQLVEEMLL